MSPVLADDSTGIVVEISRLCGHGSMVDRFPSSEWKERANTPAGMGMGRPVRVLRDGRVYVIVAASGGAVSRQAPHLFCSQMRIQNTEYVLRIPCTEIISRRAMISP